MDWKEIYKKEEPEESALYEPIVYTEKAMEHFRNPRNVGQLEKPDGKGSFGDPTCGDYIEVTIRKTACGRSSFSFRGAPGRLPLPA